MTMPNYIDERTITEYVEAHVDEFNLRRLAHLKSLDLRKLLRRKNPYLFQSLDPVGPRELIAHMMNAYLFSQEEAMFGEFLERLAIEMARLAYGGRKSGITGIDLELEKGDDRYIVSIKSGPNWGNSSQLAKMRTDFRNATRTIRRGNPTVNVVAVNGCCYGQTTASYDKGDYLKLSGRAFWLFLTGDDSFYLRIVEPLGYLGYERNETFAEDRAVILRKFENEFAKDFCDPRTGRIDWNSLVRYNSDSANNAP